MSKVSWEWRTLTDEMTLMLASVTGNLFNVDKYYEEYSTKDLP